ncbi:hypothetical protein A0H81_04411 [Grifola frondosa]|uniref:Uncharacterized protein n=1 Tax=Grifola frondosa TaxID=5627 RepID=A0A1C7MFY1_GRIFR|nr:hypothetical protein A0H81_04411 [Grifola frondosa]
MEGAPKLDFHVAALSGRMTSAPKLRVNITQVLPVKTIKYSFRSYLAKPLNDHISCSSALEIKAAVNLTTKSVRYLGAVSNASLKRLEGTRVSIRRSVYRQDEQLIAIEAMELPNRNDNAHVLNPGHLFPQSRFHHVLISLYRAVERRLTLIRRSFSTSSQRTSS